MAPRVSWRGAVVDLSSGALSLRGFAAKAAAAVAAAAAAAAGAAKCAKQAQVEAAAQPTAEEIGGRRTRVMAHRSSQVKNYSTGNMEQASSRGHEASPQSGLGVG